MQTETTMQTETSTRSETTTRGETGTRNETMTVEAVTIVERHDEWDVVIVENGVEHSQSFLQADWAINYARGQRVRLGLPATPEPSLQSRQ